MVATDVDAERTYDEEKFTARTVFESERMKVVLGYFDAGQFIPVHAPDSDVAITALDGEGTVRVGETDHAIEPGDVVVASAGEYRGVIADAGSRLEAMLVTSPPPTDAEHEPVREGLRAGTFDHRDSA